MGRVCVAEEAEFEEGSRKFVFVDGREVGVVYTDGTYYAISNTCPHQGGPVAEGIIRRGITADAPSEGTRIRERYDEKGQVVRCPCHGWGFYLETGKNLADPDRAPGIPTYAVVVEDGMVYVEDTPSGSR